MKKEEDTPLLCRPCRVVSPRGGDTRGEAVERAQEAIEGFIEALKIIGKPVPESDVEIAEVQVNVS